MYGAKANANYEGISIATLPPGIHKNFELYEVKVDKATKGDGTEGKNIITFLFTGPDGQAHQHTEWEILPTDKDAEKKADNMVLRIGHILHKYVSEDVVKSNTTSTWSDYTSWIMSVLGNSYKGVKVDLKILGNVYNGKATSNFPGYLPFIKKSSEGGLAFSAKEAAANAAYYQAIATTPDTEGSAPPVQGGSAPKDVDF